MPRYPVNNRIKIPSHIPFGQPDPNSRWKRHAGDDSANGSGTAVYAPASGVVTGYTGDQYQGLVVEIRDGQYYPHVFHLRSREVSPGQSVSEGQLIGYSGSTGLSSGPHVHFGVGKKSLLNITSFSEFIDPMEYIKQGGKKMLSEDDFYRVFRGMMGRDPTSDEAKNFSRDPAVVIPTLWNNGSQARYEADKTGSHNVLVDNVQYIKKG